MFLPGCAKEPVYITQFIAPPTVHIQEVPEPKLKGNTNKDLVDYVLSLRQGLRLSNSDKQALQTWVIEMSKETR